MSTSFSFHAFAVEVIPDTVDKWFNQIGVDFTHFPNLTRLWGEGHSEYAFTFHYEISNERDAVTHRDYPVVLPYNVQLKLLLEACEKIAQAIPYAIVRFSEMAAFQEQHDLEIAFLYPCEPEKVIAGNAILKAQFDYVWDVGRDPREPARAALPAPVGVSADVTQSSFEFALPNGMSFTVKIGGDPEYPGVFIHLKQPDGKEEMICCAEFNSAKPKGKEICLCVYAHNLDEPTYYASYHDDGVPCGVV